MAVLQLRLPITHHNAVFILHGNDIYKFPCLLYVAYAYFGKAYVLNQPIFLGFLQKRQRFFKRHIRVYSMQLVKVNAAYLQSFQAALQRLLQVVRIAVHVPLIGAASCKPTLSANHKTGRVGV